MKNVFTGPLFEIFDSYYFIQLFYFPFTRYAYKKYNSVSLSFSFEFNDFERKVQLEDFICVLQR